MNAVTIVAKIMGTATAKKAVSEHAALLQDAGGRTPRFKLGVQQDKNKGFAEISKKGWDKLLTFTIVL